MRNCSSNMLMTAVLSTPDLWIKPEVPNTQGWESVLRGMIYIVRHPGLIDQGDKLPG